MYVGYKKHFFIFHFYPENGVTMMPKRRLLRKFYSANCKTLLMERDALVCCVITRVTYMTFEVKNDVAIST